jgi:hypothetical protein
MLKISDFFGENSENTPAGALTCRGRYNICASQPNFEASHLAAQPQRPRPQHYSTPKSPAHKGTTTQLAQKTSQHIVRLLLTGLL